MELCDGLESWGRGREVPKRNGIPEYIQLINFTVQYKLT